MSIWHTDVSITGVHVWVHVWNTLVFNEILERRCSLMLLVTHSAMQLRSLSAWPCLHATVHHHPPHTVHVHSFQLSFVSEMRVSISVLNLWHWVAPHTHWSWKQGGLLVVEGRPETIDGGQMLADLQSSWSSYHGFHVELGHRPLTILFLIMLTAWRPAFGFINRLIGSVSDLHPLASFS